MGRTVQRELIDGWIRTHRPDGLAKLASRTGISTSMISKVRVGRVPTLTIYRRALAKALGISEDELFPLLEQGKDSAS